MFSEVTKNYLFSPARKTCITHSVYKQSELHMPRSVNKIFCFDFRFFTQCSYSQTALYKICSPTPNIPQMYIFCRKKTCQAMCVMLFVVFIQFWYAYTHTRIALSAFASKNHFHHIMYCHKRWDYLSSRLYVFFA